jgi:hypothetical protein
MVLSKVSSGCDLNSRDILTMQNMVSKLGLVASASVLVQFKLAFKNLDPTVIEKLEPQSQLDILSQLLSAIHEAMTNFPKRKTAHQYEGTKKDFWYQLKNMKLKGHTNNWSTLITKALYRAQSDDYQKFWEVRKENPFSMVLSINNFTASNCYFLIKSILTNMVKKNFIANIEQCLNNFSTYNKVKLESDLWEESEEFLDEIENEYIISDPTSYNFDPIYIDAEDEEFEDKIDAINQNDEMEYETRVYIPDSENLSVLIDTKIDRMKITEYTLTRLFESVKIYSRSEFQNMSWLGPGDFTMERVGSASYYCSKYPGKSHCPKNIENTGNFSSYKKIELNEYVTKILELAESKEPKLDTSPIEDIGETLSETMGEAIRFEFEKNNLIPTPLIRKMIGDEKQELASLMKKIIGSKDFFSESITRRRNRNYLPGFMGVLKSDKLVSELKSLFGANFHYLVTGQVQVNSKTLKMLMMLINGIYYKVNNHHKALLTFLLSILREVIVSENSDSWFVDSVMTMISDIDDLYPEIDEVRCMQAPRPHETSLLSSQYSAHYTVDYMNDSSDEENDLGLECD